MAGKIPQAPRELAPEGVHNAVCIQIVDIGTHTVKFKDKEEDLRKVKVAFQLVDEETSKGDAVVVYKDYTYSASPKANLMKDLRAWLGIKDADFEMDELLNKPALVTIEHSGTYANITNIAGLPKGTKVRKATEPVYSLYLDDNFDEDVFKGLPQWLQDKIATTEEYAAVMSPKLKKGGAKKPEKAVKGKK
jgi:hypothetical protein